LIGKENSESIFANQPTQTKYLQSSIAKKRQLMSTKRHKLKSERLKGKRQNCREQEQKKKNNRGENNIPRYK
jgi:hypothetical protein